MKHVAYILLFLATCIKCMAQSKVVNTCSVKVLYTDVMNDGRLKVPKVVMANNRIADTINALLGPEPYTGFSIEALKHQEGRKIEDSSENNINSIETEVKKNADCVLSLHIQVTEKTIILSATEGMYPVRNHYLNFDLRTGRQIQVEDIIDKQKIPLLLKTLDRKLHANYAAAKKKYPAVYRLNAYNEYAFTKENLPDFYFGKDGLYFYYDFHFMHCDADKAPNSIVHLTRKELHALGANRYGL